MTPRTYVLNGLRPSKGKSFDDVVALLEARKDVEIIASESWGVSCKQSMGLLTVKCEPGTIEEIQPALTNWGINEDLTAEEAVLEEIADAPASPMRYLFTSRHEIGPTFNQAAALLEGRDDVNVRNKQMMVNIGMSTIVAECEAKVAKELAPALPGWFIVISNKNPKQ